MFLSSAIYFFSTLFIKREYDVIFYYPQHFNRGINCENEYFQHLINSCKNNNLTYIVFEEIDSSSNYKRNNLAKPFDFIFYLILLLRKLIFLDVNVIKKDKMIGLFLYRIIFRRILFKNLITISQSMVNVFRGINKNAAIFDVQHGILHPNKENYIMNRIPADNLIKNNINLLISGKAYHQILIANDSTSFFRNQSFVIGGHLSVQESKHHEFNNNILVTLQFTYDHTDQENRLLLKSLDELIQHTDKSNTFYLKNHPRFNNSINIDYLFDLDNVKIAPYNIKDCFKKCSLHVTAYSTSIFEAALVGIPTLIINPLIQYNYFQRYFSYESKYAIKDFRNSRFYIQESSKVKDWAISYYSSYDENAFLRLLK